MILLLSVLLGCNVSDQETSADVVERACQAIDGIESFRCKSCLLLGPDVVPSATPGVEFQSGLAVSAVTERWVDFSRSLERIVRHELQRWESPMQYLDYECAEDGEFYTGVDREARVGQIDFPKGLHFGVTVHNLLGSAIGSRRLPHQLRDGVLNPEVSTDPSGLKVVSGAFKPVDGSYERDVKLWCDPSRGWFPVRMEVRFTWSGTLNYRITVDDLMEKDGVWFPLGGTFKGWAIQENYPDGLTNADINAMTAEEWKAVEPRVRYTETEGPSAAQLTIDADSVEINEPWRIETFRLKIPPDFELHDLTQLEDARPEPLIEEAPPGSQELGGPAEEQGWSLQARLLLGGNIALAVLAALYFGWKRRRSQSVCLLLALTVLSGCGKKGGPGPAGTTETKRAVKIHVVGGATVDFGEQFERSLIEHKFVVRNDSGTDIELKKGLSTNCGCTIAPLKKTRLRPGEVVNVDMAVHVAANVGEEKTYTAVLHVVDPAYADISLNIKAKAKAFWSVFPQAIEIRSSRTTAIQTQLEIRGVMGEEFRITDIQIPILGAKYTLSHEEPIEVDRPCVVTFTIPPGAEGKYDIGIQTSDEDRPSKTVPMTVRADPMFRLLPKRTSVRIGETRVLKIVHPKDVAASEFRCESEHIRFEIEETEPFEKGNMVSRVRVVGTKSTQGFTSVPLSLANAVGKPFTSLLVEVRP